MKKYDICIVGAGPAGIFTAIELLRNGSKKKMCIIEKGQPVEKRVCPKTFGGECRNCKPYCHITTGFSGAGAFSDGKLSLSYEVGGELPQLIGAELAQSLIDYTDGIYLEFGADEHIEGLGNEEKVKDIRRKAIQAGLKLVDCPIRHLGTEKAHDLYLAIENYLRENGVDLIFGRQCDNIILDGDTCKGVRIEDSKGQNQEEIYADKTIIATGRRGADWLEKMCAEHNIAHAPGVVDIGVRVEVRNEIMEEVNEVLYESKLVGYPDPFMQKRKKSNDSLSDIFKDAGCDEALEKQLIVLKQTGQTDEFLRLLAKHKTSLLADLHTSQKRIDCLDFLVYKTKKELN